MLYIVHKNIFALNNVDARMYNKVLGNIKSDNSCIIYNFLNPSFIAREKVFWRDIVNV